MGWLSPVTVWTPGVGVGPFTQGATSAHLSYLLIQVNYISLMYSARAFIHISLHLWGPGHSADVRGQFPRDRTQGLV